MSNNETIRFIPNNKTFTIQYHFVEPKNIGGNTSEQYIAYNCPLPDVR